MENKPLNSLKVKQTASEMSFKTSVVNGGPSNTKSKYSLGYLH